MDGSSTGVIQLGTEEEMNDWINSIGQVTSDQNSRTVRWLCGTFHVVLIVSL